MLFIVYNYFWLLNLLSICFIFLSTLALFLEFKAHKAAGSQPINVICKIKLKIAENILPLTMKDNQGNNIANNIIFCFKDYMRIYIELMPNYVAV
jgi:hypothetical protein